MNLYGLIGYPLTHSWSAKYFNAKFLNKGDTESSYRLFPLPDLAGFPGLLQQHPALCGLNVTIPYKEQIISYLDELDEQASRIGAVNTIVITRRDGHLMTRGYNTDAAGFLQSLPPNLPGGTALILGTGGAAKAVAYALNTIGIKSRFVSRSPRSQDVYRYQDLTPEFMQSHLLVINATPAGMYPETTGLPQIPFDGITPAHFLIDLIYNPEETAFMAQGRKRSARVMNGAGMLVRQAELAWTLFCAG
jgi:shikimate dehydrogenase